MNKIALILCFLFCTSVKAANLPQASNVVTPGGASKIVQSGFTVPLSAINSGFYRICASTNSGTQGNYYSFYSQASPSSNIAYQVPSGKTFYGMSVDTMSHVAGTGMLLAYGSQAFVENSATQTGNTIVPYGNSTLVNANFQNGAAEEGDAWNVIGLTFPSTKFPAFKSNGGASIQTICITGVVQ